MLKKMQVNIRPFYSKNNAQVVKWINNLQLDLTDKIEELKEAVNTTSKTKNKQQRSCTDGRLHGRRSKALERSLS